MGAKQKKTVFTNRYINKNLLRRLLNRKGLEEYTDFTIEVSHANPS